MEKLITQIGLMSAQHGAPPTSYKDQVRITRIKSFFLCHFLKVSTIDAGCQDATNEAEDDTECECEKCVDDNDDSEGMDDYGIEYEYYTNHGDNTEDESLSE